MRAIFFLLLIPILSSAKHYGPAFDARPRDALDRFACELAKKNQWEFLNSGFGSLIDANKCIWAISLVSHQKLTIEQGRSLATELSQQLLHKIYQDPLFANYCKKDAACLRSSDLKIEYAGFKLAFWDENVDRPLPPYLAQIRLAEGKLYYYYADPTTQALTDPIIEPLQLLTQ